MIYYNQTEFPTPKSLVKYVKDVLKNNHNHFMIAEKIEVSLTNNEGKEIGIILKAKAKKVKPIEPIRVDIYW
jgi:hypothetical protein